MKFMLIIIASLVFTACAHKHHHEEGAAHSDCGCDKIAAEKKAEHDCKECDGKKPQDKKQQCCTDKSCKSKEHDHSASCKMDAASTGTPVAPLSTEKITQQISQEEFSKLYTKNKTQMGKTCSNSAMAYCGKTTKDMMVSESEASCLWTKVFRVSRETLPELDGTPCAKMIKGFAKK